MAAPAAAEVAADERASSVGERAEAPLDETMIVELLLQQVASELIETPALGEEPGVPVLSVLEWLEIPHETREGGGLVEGYLGGRARAFELRGTASLTFQEEVYELAEDEAAWHEGELFLAPRVWRDVFGIEFLYQPARLRVILRPDSELPVYRRRQMERARRYRDPWIADREPAEIRLAPHDAYVGGHVLDWSLRSANMLTPGEMGGTSLRLHYGGEVYGGALQVAGSTRATGPVDVATSRVSWSRGWDHPALRELRLGGLSSPGPSRRQLIGAMATNAPIYPIQRFGFADLLLELPPSAPVDVLLGGQLLDHADTGEDGVFSLSAPLRYGHNRLELQYIDEFGELRSDELFFRVPRQMMREGELYYHVASGVDAVESGLALTTAQAAVGATSWLSLGAGGELIAGFQDDVAPGVHPYGSAHLRLDRRTFLHLEGAMAGRTGGTLDFASASGWRAAASHHELSHHPVLSRSSLRRDTSIGFGVPLELFGHGAGIQVQGREAQFRTGRRSSQLRSNLLFRHPDLGYFNTGYEWRGDLIGLERDRGLAQLRWSPPLPRDLPGGRLRLGLEVEVHEGRFRQLTSAWSRYLRKLDVRMDLGYRARRDVATGWHHEGTLSLRRYFDAAWTRSSARVPTTGQPRLHAEAGGSVNWSPEEDAWTFHRRGQVGRGRLLLRLRGHEVPRGSYSFIVDGRRHAVGENGQVAVDSLARERTYRVFVETAPSADPLLSTRFDELDVRVRANRTVIVDVPLDENFEIEGSVYREPAPGARRGLGSVRMQLRREADGERRSLRSFQDGFVYDYGIPPGVWQLEPDPEQMQRRDLVVRPSSIAIEHRPEDGLALYDRLEFLAGAPETMTDEALEERIWAALAAGELESAYATSRVLLREAPGSVAVSLATTCEAGDVEAVTALRDALRGLGSIVAAPSAERRGCVEILARAGDPRDDATHRFPRADAGASFADGVYDSLSAVSGRALLERRP